MNLKDIFYQVSQLPSKESFEEWWEIWKDSPELLDTMDRYCKTLIEQKRKETQHAYSVK